MVIEFHREVPEQPFDLIAENFIATDDSAGTQNSSNVLGPESFERQHLDEVLDQA